MRGTADFCCPNSQRSPCGLCAQIKKQVSVVTSVLVSAERAIGTPLSRRRSCVFGVPVPVPVPPSSVPDQLVVAESGLPSPLAQVVALAATVAATGAVCTANDCSLSRCHGLLREDMSRASGAAGTSSTPSTSASASSNACVPGRDIQRSGDSLSAC